MNYLFQLDGNILLFIQNHIRQDWMNGFWTTITSLGNGGWFWIALSIALLLFKKTRPVGIAAVLSLIIGALITNVTLKNLVARTRPYEVIDSLQILITKPKDFSFPSGHSCASFAAAMTYYRMSPKKYGVPALILATLIAISRLYIGVHFPTDVIAGVLIGIFASWASYKILEKMDRKMEKKKIATQDN